jgi:hypothetical protein
MIEIELFASRPSSATFPGRVDPAIVRRLRIPAGHARKFWRDTLEAVRRAGSRPDLVEAIERALRRSERRDRVRAALSTLGLAPSRLRAVDDLLRRRLAGRLLDRPGRAGARRA